MHAHTPPFTLPDSAAARKAVPLASGLLDYFPNALIAVASLSFIANEQHNPGEQLHWNRSKSTDHDDCLMRHFMARGTVDTDGILHRAKVAWRALAALQMECEKRANQPTVLNDAIQPRARIVSQLRITDISGVERLLYRLSDGSYISPRASATPDIPRHVMAAEELRSADEFNLGSGATGL